jgi:hypothetical protein
MPAQTGRHERRPEPQEQGCLARPRHANDELVRPQPLVSDRREPSGPVADGPDHGPDDDQIAAHGERHRAGRRDPGPGRALLAPPLPLVEGDSGSWGPAADASTHGLGSVCPGERRGRQAERDRRRRDRHHGARKRSGRGQVPERQPGVIGGGGEIQPSRRGPRDQGQPDGDHGPAPCRGGQQPARRPAAPRCQGDRADGDRGHWRGRDGDHR